MQLIRSSRWTGYAGPAFLVLVLLASFITPGTVYDKFNMVCFGI